MKKTLLSVIILSCAVGSQAFGQSESQGCINTCNDICPSTPTLLQQCQAACIDYPPGSQPMGGSWEAFWTNFSMCSMLAGD
jgi:hypothetical protein